MPKRFLVLIAAIATLALPAGSAAAAPSKNIVETASANPKFSTLVSRRAAAACKLSCATAVCLFHPMRGIRHTASQ